jgi:hypothetical protein
MNMETVHEVPEPIIAVEQGEDVYNKLESHLTSKKAMVFDEEVSDDGVSHHNGIVGCIVSRSRKLFKSSCERKIRNSNKTN